MSKKMPNWVAPAAAAGVGGAVGGPILAGLGSLLAGRIQDKRHRPGSLIAPYLGSTAGGTLGLLGAAKLVKGKYGRIPRGFIAQATRAARRNPRTLLGALLLGSMGLGGGLSAALVHHKALNHEPPHK